jgi:ABC-type Fe3+/spermidine/putrescine transport system ATPase subunit
MNAFEISQYRRPMGHFDLHAHFSLQATDRLALLGPSGCGKTSLLRAIAGVNQGIEEQGTIRVQGKEIQNLPPEKREVGLVFQDFALFPALDVFGNLTFGLRARGVPRSLWNERLQPWIERFGLSSRIKESISTLSGGEKQRVALVRTAVTEPKVLLLDEPFSALDTELRRQAAEAIREMQERLRVPLIFVTHDVADVERLATHRIEVRQERSSANSRWVHSFNF